MQEIIIVSIVLVMVIVSTVKLSLKSTVRQVRTRSRSTSNAGYVDFSGGRLTERNFVCHDHLEIKTIDNRR